MKHLLVRGIVLTAGIFAATAACAGSANATFDCKSASGRTVLKASVPGDHVEHLVELSIDGETVEWKDVIMQQSPFKNIKNSSIFVLGAMKKKNFHFLLTAPEDSSANSIEVFRFSAVPSSIKVKRTSNGERGQLSAIIVGRDPRAKKNGKASPKIVVDCSYSYEI
jgi:hypothetical protein